MGRRAKNPREHSPGHPCAYCGGTGISAIAQIQALREQRIDLFIKQKAIAQRLDIATNVISQWETGRNAPTPEDIRNYKLALKDIQKEMLAVQWASSSEDDRMAIYKSILNGVRT